MELNRNFNNTALIHSAYNGYTEIVRLLIAQKEIDVNIKDILKSKSFILSKYCFFFNHVWKYDNL